MGLRRELASNSVLTRPAIRSRMEELLMALARSSASAQQDLAERLGGLGLPGGIEGVGGMDLESLQGMFGDPEALLGDLLTPESRRSSDQLTALAVVIDGYADHVANLVGQKLVGSHAQLAEAWYRRRTERGKGEEAAGALFGLDLDQAQVDRGRSFISGVLERAGDDGLASYGSRITISRHRRRSMLPDCGWSGSACPDSTHRQGTENRTQRRVAVAGGSLVSLRRSVAPRPRGPARSARRRPLPPRAPPGPTRAGCSPARHRGSPAPRLRRYCGS